MEKYDTTWKDLIAPLLNTIKTKDKLYFTTLNYALYYTLHPKLYSLTANLTLRCKVYQGVIVYDAKHAFKKFMVQSEKWYIV